MFAKEAGLRAGIGITPNSQDLPLYDDDRYEPLWAVCADLELPVNMHTGSGKPDYGTTRAGCDAQRDRELVVLVAPRCGR